MASIAAASPTPVISPLFDKLFKDITDDLSQEERKHAVSSIKSNFEGKFNAQGEQDLYSCLHLFANQGLVSEDNLTLLEQFIVKSPKKEKKKEEIQKKIHNFKATRLQAVTTRKELTGRDSDLTNIMTKLTGSESRILNLYGSSGVGKTRLAMEAFSLWRGTKFKVDLRVVNVMKDVYFHVLQELSAGSGETKVSYHANPVIDKMQQVKRDSTSDILLLLDNVDQFVESTKSLNTGFVTFLERLLDSKTWSNKAKLKILLTSRSAFRHGVENHEVRALEKESSGQLLHSQGITNIPGNQREQLVKMCKGKPLLLNGMAAILRQEIADAERLLGAIEQELEVPPQATATPSEGMDTEERETFNIQEEGIDEEQLSCLRKMFFFLPSQTLKESAVSVSLFCRSFSVEDAAKILNVDSSEAAIRMEGIRNSKVVSVSDEKELLYDIHPLMRKFLKSIGNCKAFTKAYQRARVNFGKHFVSKIRDISALLDQDFVKAFERFDLDKQNFELALDISIKTGSLLISEEHPENTMIYYLFKAMLDDKQRRNIFHSWAKKVEEGGKEARDDDDEDEEEDGDDGDYDNNNNEEEEEVTDDGDEDDESDEVGQEEVLVEQQQELQEEGGQDIEQSVSVTVRKKAVPTKAKIPLQLKESPGCSRFGLCPHGNLPEQEDTMKKPNGGGTSFQMEDILRVTLLATEWGSLKGGLSTLNRELAKCLAQQPNVSVTILLPKYNESEKEEARKHKVNLATPEMIPGMDQITSLSFPSKDHQIDIVVGHGQKIGPPAQAIASQRNCKRVHIVHTNGEELAMFKMYPQAISEGEEKRQVEVKLCKTADMVLAIGPKLTETTSASLRRYSVDVVSLTPGIFSEFSELKQASKELTNFRVLVFGRGDPEDFELKGYGTAAQAVAGLKDNSYRLIFVGAQDGKRDEVKNSLIEFGISPNQLTVRGYIESRQELADLFCEADLAIMPSRSEGFGLAALEALSAGLPILVSDNSGFGEALSDVPNGSMSVVDSCDVEKWIEAIRLAKEKPRHIRLKDASDLRANYGERYNWKEQCADIVMRMCSIK